MRRQNEAGSKFNHPPAPQPRHQSVARQSLRWHARRPGIPRSPRGVRRGMFHELSNGISCALGTYRIELAVRLSGLVSYPKSGHAVWLGGLCGGVRGLERGGTQPSWVVPREAPGIESKWLMDDGVVVEPLSECMSITRWTSSTNP